MYFDRIRTAKPRWAIIYITAAIILFLIFKPHIKGLFHDTKQAVTEEKPKVTIQAPSRMDNTLTYLFNGLIWGILPLKPIDHFCEQLRK